MLFVLRTRRPFFRSGPSRLLVLSSVALAVVTLAIPYSPLAGALGLTAIVPRAAPARSSASPCSTWSSRTSPSRASTEANARTPDRQALATVSDRARPRRTGWCPRYHRRTAPRPSAGSSPSRRTWLEHRARRGERALVEVEQLGAARAAGDEDACRRRARRRFGRDARSEHRPDRGERAGRGIVELDRRAAVDEIAATAPAGDEHRAIDQERRGAISRARSPSSPSSRTCRSPGCRARRSPSSGSRPAHGMHPRR